MSEYSVPNETNTYRFTSILVCVCVCVHVYVLPVRLMISSTHSELGFLAVYSVIALEK